MYDRCFIHLSNASFLETALNGCLFLLFGGKKMVKNSKIRELLIVKYNICFLGGTVCNQNPYTLHHIIPVRDGGKTSEQNGALLCRLQHDMLNEIEIEYIKKAKEINEYFTYFKESKDINALKDMKYYVEDLIKRMGFQVEEQGKIYRLKRR